MSKRGGAVEAGSLASAFQGIGTSCTDAASASSAGLAVALSIGRTIVQWCPIGQYWKRRRPRRAAFSEPNGTHMVVNT